MVVRCTRNGLQRHRKVSVRLTFAMELTSMQFHQRSPLQRSLDLLRIYLGVALVVRGGVFMGEPDKVTTYLESGDWFLPMIVTHYVGLAHFGGGLLLVIGLATRLAAVVQLPVLFAAVFLVHWREGLMSQGQSLELSALVLALLALYSFIGSGRLSVDASMNAERAASSTSPDIL